MTPEKMDAIRENRAKLKLNFMEVIESGCPSEEVAEQLVKLLEEFVAASAFATMLDKKGEVGDRLREVAGLYLDDVGMRKPAKESKPN